MMLTTKLCNENRNSALRNIMNKHTYFKSFKLTMDSFKLLKLQVHKTDLTRKTPHCAIVKSEESNPNDR